MWWGSRLGRDRQRRRSVPRCRATRTVISIWGLAFRFRFLSDSLRTIVCIKSKNCAILKIGSDCWTSMIAITFCFAVSCDRFIIFTFLISFYESYTRVHRFNFNRKRNIVGANFSNPTRRGNFLFVASNDFIFQQQYDKSRNRNINTIIMWIE